MESVGTLYTMRECKWEAILSRTPQSLLPTTDIPRILIKDTKGTVPILKEYNSIEFRIAHQCNKTW